MFIFIKKSKFLLIFSTKCINNYFKILVFTKVLNKIKEIGKKDCFLLVFNLEKFLWKHFSIKVFYQKWEQFYIEMQLIGRVFCGYNLFLSNNLWTQIIMTEFELKWKKRGNFLTKLVIFGCSILLQHLSLWHNSRNRNEDIAIRLLSRIHFPKRRRHWFIHRRKTPDLMMIKCLSVAWKADNTWVEDHQIAHCSTNTNTNTNLKSV